MLARAHACSKLVLADVHALSFHGLPHSPLCPHGKAISAPGQHIKRIQPPQIPPRNPHFSPPPPPAPAMSLFCGLECVVCLGCSRWAWKRLTYVGSYDSESWPPADAASFAPVPRLCRLILAVYEDDLSNPRFAPPGGYRLDPAGLIKRVPYSLTDGRSPPYLIYADRHHREIVLAVRGLNLARESDYKVLLDNRLGMQMFDGGFVHHGLLKSAVWILNRETGTLRDLLRDHGPEYKLVFTGHSLGSGVAALMTILVVNHRDQFGGIERERVRCYAIAPARCMSLNLAVKYADVINSVVLQDDFLPRTPTPLEYIFGSIFCLPCLLFMVCIRDTFIPEKRKLKDQRRLYAPGRMYHIVERKFCRCGRFPPEVRTAIPVEGRFEHVVLSCTATSDHAIIWIAREAEKALDIMMENTEATDSPAQQKMERKQSLQKAHRAALEKAVSLNVPHAVVPKEDSGEEIDASHSKKPDEAGSYEANEAKPVEASEASPSKKQVEVSSSCSGPNYPSEKMDEVTTSMSGLESQPSTTGNWDVLVEKLFTRNESGRMVFKDIDIADS